MSHLPSPSSEVRAGYLDNAVREMKVWRATGVSVAAIEAAAEATPDGQRYQVIGGRIFRVPGRPRQRADWFERGVSQFDAAIRALVAAAGSTLPDLDFVVNLGDYAVAGVPLLSTWVKDGIHNPRIPSSALWPGQAPVHTHADEAHVLRGHRVFEDHAVATPFSERLNKVAWRGSATGLFDGTVNGYRWRHRFRLPWGSEHARIRLVRLAARHPNLVDAALAGFPQTSEKNSRFLRAHLPVQPFVPQSWFLRHRYVVNVDGNVATWSLLTLIGSGSVVLRQRSPYLEFCTRQLEQHRPLMYIQRDLGDLLEVAAWALAHPDEGAALAERARSFAASWLSASAVDYYFRALLAEYAAALTEPVTLARGATPI